MRHSLLARLLLVSLLIVVCSIAATAWLATLTVSRGIEQQQGRTFGGDAVIYQGLLDYAVTNRSWDGVGPVVHELSQRTGLRIALTDQQDRPIAGSGPGPAPTGTAVMVDPLALNPDLIPPEARSGPVDPRVVGPFALTPSERRTLEVTARKIQACVNQRGGHGAVAVAPNGRPSVESSPPQLARDCGAEELAAVPTRSESRALASLQASTNTCLGASRLPPVKLSPDLTWSEASASSSAVNALDVGACLLTARRQMLLPYVPPPARLLVAPPVSETPVAFNLSRTNLLRTVWIVGAVVMVACGVTAVAGIRIVRPLRMLTRAAQQAADGDTAVLVPARGRDEVARLAAAFNEMSTARARLEATRKALVTDIAHELRTPLTNIRGWLETTQDGLAERTAERDELLLDETLHLQRIVNDLQDLAMSDAGALRLHPQRLLIAPLLAQVRSAHTAAAASRGVRLEVAAPPGLSVQADPQRLRQVLENLIDNALRHTPRDGEVTVSGRAEDAGVRIDVVDTGPGISEEDLLHVFDRFWRADRSRQRSTGGSGLGLAIARSLAEGHGGTLTAARIPDGGTRFTLLLPGGACR